MALPGDGHVLRSPLFASLSGAYRNLFCSLHFLRGVLYRLDDVDVAGAAAQVARDANADLLLGGVRVTLQERQAGHHHSRRAIATLKAMLLLEAFLKGMQFTSLL